VDPNFQLIDKIFNEIVIACTRQRGVMHSVVIYVQSVFIEDCIVTNEWPLRVFRLKDRAAVLASRFSNLHLQVVVMGRQAELDISTAKANCVTKEISDLK
jgi:hypothetical protein